MQFAEAIATIAVLVYEWYIARVALAVTGAQAALVVIIDVVLGTTLGGLARRSTEARAQGVPSLTIRS